MEDQYGKLHRRAVQRGTSLLYDLDTVYLLQSSAGRPGQVSEMSSVPEISARRPSSDRDAVGSRLQTSDVRARLANSVTIVAAHTEVMTRGGDVEVIA